MYVVLAGGVGAARFLKGLVRVVPPEEVVAVVNVGDDLWLHGLRICPDLDSITYHLAGVVDPDRQWGRAEESEVVAGELERFGADRWFTLGDRDLATHLHRTERLRGGVSLSTVTAEVAEAFGVAVRLLPATDDEAETRILTADGRDLHFQEYWVRERGRPEVAEVSLADARRAQAGPGVVEAILDADAVLLAPSNPVVSVDPVRAVPDIGATLQQTPAPVVGVSPIVGGAVVRGMADRLLPSVGAEVSALGVARHYADLLDGWVIDDRDADLRVGIEEELGIETRVTDTMMDDPEVAGALAATVLELAAELRR
jgi:LPPG:FO 2-phospho-L-lactate transferase